MNGSRKTIPLAKAGLHRAGAAIGLAVAVTAAAAVPAHAAGGGASPARNETPVTVGRGADGALTLTATGVRAAAATTAAPAPSTRPGVPRVFLAPGQSTPCERGRACAAVPYGNGVYVFKFYRYGAYALSYWAGVGGIVNNQTGGAAIRYDGGGGGRLGCVPAGHGRGGIDWNPVWRIRLTASGC